jgi:hypothetical protein
MVPIKAYFINVGHFRRNPRNADMRTPSMSDMFGGSILAAATDDLSESKLLAQLFA